MGIPDRPEHCTRTRMKPFVDACECEWCIAINQQWLEEIGETDGDAIIFTDETGVLHCDHESELACELDLSGES